MGKHFTHFISMLKNNHHDLINFLTTASDIHAEPSFVSFKRFHRKKNGVRKWKVKDNKNNHALCYYMLINLKKTNITDNIRNQPHLTAREKIKQNDAATKDICFEYTWLTF